MAEKLDDRTEDLGSRDVLKNYSDLIFKPAEADVSINLGWFYHNNLYYLFKKQRTAKDLAKIYFDSVGGNASMLLNIPPDKDGLINKREIKTLEKFTKLITEPFKNEITDKEISVYSPDGAYRTDEKGVFYLEKGEAGIKISLKKKTNISLLSLREDLSFSQRVEEFKIFIKNENENYECVYNGTVIGSRKIVRLDRAVLTDEALIIVTQSRANPVLKDIRIYE